MSWGKTDCVLRVGIIGCGVMGAHYARVVAAMPFSRLLAFSNALSRFRSSITLNLTSEGILRKPFNILLNSPGETPTSAATFRCVHSGSIAIRPFTIMLKVLSTGIFLS